MSNENNWSLIFNIIFPLFHFFPDKNFFFAFIIEIKSAISNFVVQIL